MTGVKGPIGERFWSKVDKAGPIPAHRPELGPCWIWTAYLDKKGQGWLRTRKADGSHTRTRASRVSWVIHHGPLADSLKVLHRCDNPACVRPSHLFTGTQAENMRDMTEKGRRAMGAALNMTKVTEDDVREIRRLHQAGVVQRRISEQFGISAASVCLIVNGKHWRYIE